MTLADPAAPPEPVPPAPARWRWGPVVLGALLVGLLSALATVPTLRAEQRMDGFGRTLVVQLAFWGLWGLAAPLVVAAVRRWPLERARLARTLPVHVAVGVALALVQATLVALLVVELFGPGEPTLSFGRVFSGYLLNRWQLALLVYALAAGAWQVAESRRRLRAREVQAARLEAQLAQAQLTALEMQLHPHFLFNTLQAISTLVTEDPAAARRMLVLLGDLLRAVLDGAGQAEVPLGRELDFVGRYLEIERTRFPDRLAVAIEVPAPLRSARVPNLLLQPLVENAIRHGIAPRTEPGRVTIRAARAGDRLTVEVLDDGAGPGGTPAGTNGRGLGLATTRARLEQLYGTAQRLAVERRAEGGTRVRVELPWREGA